MPYCLYLRKSRADIEAGSRGKSETYEYLINMADDPDVIDQLKFLREREVVHYQRFGEALRIVQERLQEPHLFIMPNIK